LFNFIIGQIVGGYLAGAAVTKTATLLGVSTTVSKVMSAYTNYGKTTSGTRTVDGNQHWQNEIVVNLEGLFRKVTELPQHR
jgi:hypothetical protein